MTGNELFAVIFIFTAFIGLYIATFFEIGGHKIVVDKLLKFIESRRKKRDI